jgi:hypothetical protein
MPSTKAKYTSMMIQSIKVRFTGQVLKIAAITPRRRRVTTDEEPISTTH